MNGENLQTYLDAFAGKTVGVLGDFLLDEYILGNSARVSREAPIVVIDYVESAYHPGGASNAAQNIAALGGTALAFGILGDDREGTALRELLERKRVDVEGLITDNAAQTSVKLRIMAGELNAQKQQVARVDRNHRLALRDETVDTMKARLSAALEKSDAFLISDYGMGIVPGVLSRLVIETAREKRVPVVIDSRYDLRGFSGATVATPNEVEALATLQLQDESLLDVPDTMARLVDASGIASFVVTRGSKGMLVHDAGGVTETMGIVGSAEATDVTGAGDTVSATIALALACGAPLVDAARLATFAASSVVMKRGTATTSPEELRAMMTTNPAADA